MVGKEKMALLIIDRTSYFTYEYENGLRGTGRYSVLFPQLQPANNLG